MSTEALKIAVCRDGPRGWHWIKLEHFDPAKHVPYPPPQEAAPAVPVKRPVGRPRKNTTHVSNGAANHVYR